MNNMESDEVKIHLWIFYNFFSSVKHCFTANTKHQEIYIVKLVEPIIWQFLTRYIRHNYVNVNESILSHLYGITHGPLREWSSSERPQLKPHWVMTTFFARADGRHQGKRHGTGFLRKKIFGRNNSQPLFKKIKFFIL